MRGGGGGGGGGGGEAARQIELCSHQRQPEAATASQTREWPAYVLWSCKAIFHIVHRQLIVPSRPFLPPKRYNDWVVWLIGSAGRGDSEPP